MVGTSTPRRVERASVEDAESMSSAGLAFIEAAARLATFPIRTPEHYEMALEAIRLLFRGPHDEGTLAGNTLGVLAILVENYEEENVPDLGDASPQEVVQFMAEQKGVSNAKLAELLGGRSRLSDFMNEKRELSREQIKKLRQVLGVPADLLIAMALLFTFAIPHVALAIS